MPMQNWRVGFSATATSVGERRNDISLTSFPRDHAREKSHHPTERVLPRRFKVRQAGQRMHDERSVFRSGVRESGPIHTAQANTTTYRLARSNWRSNRLPRCTAESSAACADFLLPT
jgi:hypothetical protein